MTNASGVGKTAQPDEDNVTFDCRPTFVSSTERHIGSSIGFGSQTQQDVGR